MLTSDDLLNHTGRVPVTVLQNTIGFPSFWVCISLSLWFIILCYIIPADPKTIPKFNNGVSYISDNEGQSIAGLHLLWFSLVNNQGAFLEGLYPLSRKKKIIGGNTEFVIKSCWLLWKTPNVLLDMGFQYYTFHKKSQKIEGFFLLLELSYISLYHSQQMFFLSSIGSGSLRSNKVTSMEMFVVS